MCIYVYTDSRYHWFQAVRVSVDITETRRGIRNRSSHLSQTRPRHDTSRISWDNRFISTPRIPFGNGTTDSFLGISRLRSGGKIGEDTDSISILFFSILFFFVISLWISEIFIIRFFWTILPRGNNIFIELQWDLFSYFFLSFSRSLFRYSSWLSGVWMEFFTSIQWDKSPEENRISVILNRELLQIVMMNYVSSFESLLSKVIQRRSHPVPPGHPSGLRSTTPDPSSNTGRGSPSTHRPRKRGPLVIHSWNTCARAIKA